MHSRTTILLILNLLFTQIITFEHMAEHGFEEHEHNEVSCEFTFYCENSNFINGDPKSDYSKLDSLSENNEYSKRYIFISFKYYLPLYHAPPILS